MSELSVAPVGARRRTWSVWAASLFQATLAGFAIVGAYGTFFAVFGGGTGNGQGDDFTFAATIMLIATPFAIAAGLLSGSAAALVITRRRSSRTLLQLRWVVALAVFGVCLAVALLLFPLIVATFPLPFIAAGIAAWRTKDLARPERRGGPAMTHADQTVDGSV